MHAGVSNVAVSSRQHQHEQKLLLLRKSNDVKMREAATRVASLG